MQWVRSGRRKVGWTAAVAVVIALVGHALLMAGGGHPAEAAHAVPVSMVAAPHGSTAYHATITADVPRTATAGHDAHRAFHAGRVSTGSPAPPAVDPETTVEPHPTDGHPASDRTDGCGGLLALIWPQPQLTPSSGSTSVALPAAFDLVVLPVAESRVGSSRLDPIASPGTRRALLQIYRL